MDWRIYNLSLSVKKALKTLLKLYYFLWFRSVLIAHKRAQIVIFDIDNTLANTWPTYHMNFACKKERLRQIQPFPRMIQLVQEYYQKGASVFFISARRYRDYWITRQWLIDQKIYNGNLIIVNSPEEKIKFLQIASHHGWVEYYDDLSYNHENGEVKFYERCIEQVYMTPNVRYYDYHQIRRLQVGE